MKMATNKEKEVLNSIISNLLEYRMNRYTIILEYERNMMGAIFGDLSKHDLGNSKINYLISSNTNTVVLTLTMNEEV